MSVASFLLTDSSYSNQDFSKFHSHKPKLLEEVDQMLAEDIAKLMAMVPHDTSPPSFLEVSVH